MDNFKKWTQTEELNLLQEYKTMPIDDIARKHDRSINAIHMRLKNIAVKMSDIGVNYNTIMNETGCSETDIQEHKEYIKQQRNTGKNDNNDNITLQLVMNEIIKLRTMVETLINK